MDSLVLLMGVYGLKITFVASADVKGILKTILIFPFG